MDETKLYVIDQAEADRLVSEANAASIASGEPAMIPEFQRARLTDLKLTVSSLLFRLYFYASKLTGVDFGGSNLNGFGFGDARLERCNLSHLSAAKLEGENTVFEECTFRSSYLRWGHFKDARFERCDLTQADLSSAFCIQASLHGSILEQTVFKSAWLDGADLEGTVCRGTVFNQAHMRQVKLAGVQLQGCDFEQADLQHANLEGADLRGAKLAGADLRRARLAHARLGGADLSHANLSGADLRHADLSGAKVYGVSAWDVGLENTMQCGLVIAPADQSPITVDDLEVAQFVYLLGQNPKLRRVIDTITSRVVLILGRFTPERKAVLDAIREELRRRDWVPILFDFDKPSQRDFTETVLTLTGLSRFVIADITNPKSSPLELQAAVPNYMVPFVVIIQEGEEPFSMFVDLRVKYGDWVLEPITYDTVDNLRRGFEKGILVRALEKHADLMVRRTQELTTRDIRDYV